MIYDAAIAGAIMASFVGFGWAVRWNLGITPDVMTFAGIAGAIGAIASLIMVRLLGPTTIRDTLWAMLDTESA